MGLISECIGGGEGKTQWATSDGEDIEENEG